MEDRENTKRFGELWKSKRIVVIRLLFI